MTELNDKNDVTVETLNTKEGEMIMKTDESKTGTVQPVEDAVVSIDLADIQRDDYFRCRETDNDAKIREYAELFLENKEAKENNKKPKHNFPPILVWYDKESSRYFLLGGYHRIGAAQLAGYDKIEARVFYGSKEDALLLAIRDNSTHGQSYSQGDKKFAIMKALENFHDKRPSSSIADEVGCTFSYVSRVQNEMYGKGLLVRPEKRVGKDGKQYTTARKTSKAKQRIEGSEQIQPALSLPDDCPDSNVPLSFDANEKPAEVNEMQSKTCEEQASCAIALIKEISVSENFEERMPALVRIRVALKKHEKYARAVPVKQSSGSCQ